MGNTMRACCWALQIVAVLGVILVPVLSGAEVPHVFQAGQPAVAAEVNENFEYLEGKVSAVEGVLATLDEAIEGLATEDYEYSEKDRPVGFKLLVLGQPYQIVRFEVVSFETHETFSIKFPWREQFSSSSEACSSLEQDCIRDLAVDTHEYRSGEIQSANETISGFPASVYVSVSMRYEMTSVNPGLDGYNEYQPSTDIAVIAAVSLDASTSAPVGYFRFVESDYPDLVSSAVEVPPFDRDFSDDLDEPAELPRKPTREEYVQELFSLLDYVVIRKIDGE